MTNVKFDLITTYYRSSESEREEENLYCLNQNLANPLINNIYLFLQGQDKPEVINNDKIKFIKHNKRPLFSELFHFANSIENDSTKIVSNSDIYFDNTLESVTEALKKWDVLALTRYDLVDNGDFVFFQSYKSQDSWIFNRKINVNIGNYFIGQYGCDNRLIYEFLQNKYKTGNPCFSIITYHVHSSNLRTYFQDPNYQYVLPPFGYIMPVYLKIGLDWIKNYNYLSLRYSYYTSISNNNLLSYYPSLLNRIMSKIKSKFFAFLVNRL
jgi:hypothetical protein